MKKFLAVLAVSVLAAGTAHSAELTEVDTDSDGKVTMEEAKAKMPDLTEDSFKTADADGDGSLNAEEFTKLNN